MRKIKYLLAIKFRALRPYLLSDREREKLHILEIRGFFKAFGFDTKELSDADILKGADEFNRIASKAGLTVNEALEVDRRLKY